MATFQHPASLNAFQQFGQACSILRNTTRASNPAWYAQALDLNYQLHIRPDGPEVLAFYFDKKKNQWTQGPALTNDILQDSTKLETFATEILANAKSNGATALGVVLHIADEFSTTDLKPELDNPASLPDLRDAAIRDPQSILEDASIVASNGAWRVIPYPAGGEPIGTTISLSRHYEALFATLRSTGETANFPIITHALSAPLVIISGIPRAIEPTPGKPFVAVLQYSWFTVLAFFNEHADLRFIRTLQHRGSLRAPNFRSALNTTSASLELLDPDLFLIPLGQAVDTTLQANLRIGFTNSRVESAPFPQMEGLPRWAPEPAIAAAPTTSANVTESHTFEVLIDDKWSYQDFLPTPKEVADVYPDRSEMRLLRVLRLARLGVVAIALLTLAYIAVGIVNLVRREEWNFDPSKEGIIKAHLAKLNIERQRSDHWNNLLEDRSKAWVAMEALARMFPENGGMLVKTFTHTSKPEPAPGQPRVGFIKEWRISGFAQDEAIDYLNSLNTRDGINSHFSEIHRITGNNAFNPAVGNRSLSVNIKMQENSQFKLNNGEDTAVTDETTYPFAFDLTITQRFEATDPLALTVPQAP